MKTATMDIRRGDERFHTRARPLFNGRAFPRLTADAASGAEVLIWQMDAGLQ